MGGEVVALPQRGKPGITYDTRAARQIKCFDWALGVYGAIVRNRRYQALRHFEENCELAQAQGLTVDDMILVARYVSARPAGSVKTEIGDTMIGLNIMAENLGLSIDSCETSTINHVIGLDPDKCRKKDAEKCAAGLI